VRIAIRADASVEIGAGHVARCASLAQRLREAGHEVAFLCRKLAGNLADLLECEGFLVHRLEGTAQAWTEEDDARRSRDAIGAARHDWLIVDHYALGVGWERAMAACVDRILAIDDLGREHRCDLLLDQNYPNPTHDRYRHRVPADCECLLGPRFALLRPGFAARRAASLTRGQERVTRALVFMGGSDPLDETSIALRGIAMIGSQPAVDVVIGAANPHRDAVAAACATLADATLHVQTQEMAALMARADCALGAPGSATWERCTLGLPAIVTILAENQAAVGTALEAAGAHRLLGRHGEVSAADYAAALGHLDAAALRGMSQAAAAICDGTGAQIVAAHLEAAARCCTADTPQRRYA
jgi:UDP-2,4-diacetamido-2,4,6-trideoxy-beta-L-altropyranose hydrolase